MDGHPLPVSPIELYSRLGTAPAPVLVDVRRAVDFSSSGRLIVGAVHRPAEDVERWTILALDMYEHSYHMDYGAKAADYVDVFMAAINWPAVGRLYDGVSS